MHDCVIRSATIVDGSGNPPYVADLAIDGPTITGIGPELGSGRREIDADGRHLLPGWVDIHTHYDGQATWDPNLTPSCWHGVTTAIAGNCGVGFAPVRSDMRDYLIRLMEGVEDIPGTALHEGIDWAWESFPDYLDALAGRRFAMDVGTQIAHGPLRVYVMGERGADHTSEATADELVRIRELVEEAIAAGAFGFSTTRSLNHRSSDGREAPSYSAGRAELLAVADALRASGAGTIEAVTDFTPLEDEFALLRDLAERSGRPLSVAVTQLPNRPEVHREVLARIAQANAAGLRMRAQVAARPIGVILGIGTTVDPLRASSSYVEIAALPRERLVAKLEQPGMRAKIVEEMSQAGGIYEHAFPIDAAPDYEPAPEDSIGSRARALGIPAAALAYDRVVANGGTGLLYFPALNYVAGDFSVLEEMLRDPNTLPGLGDAGAHCGTICDASFPTFLVSHWALTRTRGPRFPLEWVVKRQTSDTAALVGLRDRGRIEVGLRADLNLVNLDAFGLLPPELVHDLPAGGKRFIQRAFGYDATFVAGTCTQQGGELTGERPGRLLRARGGS